jgi:hypothetical protein
VTDLARTGRAASTIQRRIAAISQVHQLVGHVPPPTADWEVRQVVQGIRQRLGTAPTQKEALLTASLRRLVSSCDPATRAGARDRALLLLGTIRNCLTIQHPDGNAGARVRRSPH